MSLALCSARGGHGGRKSRASPGGGQPASWAKSRTCRWGAWSWPTLQEETIIISSVKSPAYLTGRYSSYRVVTGTNLGKWSGRRGSNSRHPAWKAGALPLSYSRGQPYIAARLYQSSFSRLALPGNRVAGKTCPCRSRPPLSNAAASSRQHVTKDHLLAPVDKSGGPSRLRTTGRQALWKCLVTTSSKLLEPPSGRRCSTLPHSRHPCPVARSSKKSARTPTT